MSWLFDNNGTSVARYGSNGTILETSGWKSVGTYGDNGYVHTDSGTYAGRIYGGRIFDAQEHLIGRCNDGIIRDEFDAIIGTYDGDDIGAGAAALIILLR